MPLIAEKSGFREQDAEELLDSLFEGIGTVPYGIPASAMKKARDAIGGEDIDDVPYLATAIAVDATGFGRMIVCSITNSMLRVIRPGLYVQHMIIMMFSSRFVLRDTFQVRASISSRITSQ